MVRIGTGANAGSRVRKTFDIPFSEGWFVSPLALFLGTSFLFLWLFPAVILGVERDVRYDLLLGFYFAVQLAGLLLGQRTAFPLPRGRETAVAANGSLFRACWLFWGISAIYKLAMFLLGGIAKYQHEESEALFHIPYVLMVLDSVAFRAAPFMPWVGGRGKVTLPVLLAVLIDLGFGLSTLTKEYSIYVIVSAVFGLSYWGKAPSARLTALGAVSVIGVFLLGQALIWTRMETIKFTAPLEIASGIVENVDKTLLDEIQRDATLLAAKERFDLYSSGLLAVRQREFREVAVKARDALPFFWVPRSQEKEITFRSGNYLGSSVGLVPEGDMSGIAFPNPIVLDAMFGPVGAVIILGGVSYLFGAAYRRVIGGRCLELWIGYLILYLGIMVQMYIGLPAPALPYKIVYESASWVACIALLRGCKRFAVSAWPGEAGAEQEYRLFRV